MKIGINASFARKPDSGTGQVTLNFLRKLSEFRVQSSGFKVEKHKYFLYLEEDLPANLKMPENFQKRIFLPLYKRDDLIRKIWWEKCLLPKKVKKDRCEVLLSLYQSATITKNIRHIMFVHDAVWKIFPRYLNNIRKRIYYKFVDKAIKKAGLIVTNSLNSKRDIMRFFRVPDKNIETVYLDCDPVFKKKYPQEEIEKIFKKYNLQKSPNEANSTHHALSTGNYIFYVGGFDIRKNIRNLIEAYALLWKKYHNEISIPNLVLAGQFLPHLIPLVTDIPRAIKHVSEKYGCPEKKIKLIGFVDQVDLPMLYQGADFFCYPSLYEGFGLPVLEALNSGCPVIASNASSIPEIVNKREALLVDSRQPEDIAITMHTILTDDALRLKKVDNARKKANKFSWEKFTNSIMELISKNQ